MTSIHALFYPSIRGQTLEVTGDPCLADEKPVHTVRLTQPFYLGQYEVTQAQWEAVMGNNPSHCKRDAALSVEHVLWESAATICVSAVIAVDHNTTCLTAAYGSPTIVPCKV